MTLAVSALSSQAEIKCLDPYVNENGRILTRALSMNVRNGEIPKCTQSVVLLLILWGFVFCVDAIATPPALSIRVAEVLEEADIILSFDTLQGHEHFIQFSGDFSQWTFLSYLWSGDGNRERVALSRETNRTFYRSITHPDPPETWVTAPADTALAEYRIFQSPAIGRPVSFHIFLPSAYSTNPEQQFPILYWLHGSGPGIEGIPALCNFFGTAMNLEEIPPMIIVFPNGLSHGMWCDSKDGLTPMETMLINDLIPYVDANFRTIASREGRIIEGFSMGGYGAGRLGLKYSMMFRGFSMMGAGPLQYPDFLIDDPNLNPLPLRQMLFEKVYGSDMDYYQEQSPWRLAQQLENSLPNDLSIRIIIGDEDSMLDNNRALSDHFDELGITHEYRELTGVGHLPLLTLHGIGPDNWDFYRSVFGE